MRVGYLLVHRNKPEKDKQRPEAEIRFDSPLSPNASGVLPLDFPLDEYERLCQFRNDVVLKFPYRIGKVPDLYIRTKAIRARDFVKRFEDIQIIGIQITVSGITSTGAEVETAELAVPFQYAWALCSEVPSRLPDEPFHPERFPHSGEPSTARQARPGTATTLHHAVYLPSVQKLVWPKQSLPATWGDSSKYSAWLMLCFGETSRLIELRKLSGRVRLRFQDALPTGLAVQVFRADGRWMKDLPVERETIINMDLKEIDLAGIFRRRRDIFERFWVFDGIVPERDREEAVERALYDAGITVRHKYPPEGAEEDDRVQVRGFECSCQLQGEQADIWVQYLGERKRITQRIPQEGGGWINRDVDSGEIHIHTWACHSSFKDLDTLISRFHKIVAERLASFRIV